MMNLLAHCLQPRLDPDVHFYKPKKRGGIPAKVDMRISPPEQYGEWRMEDPSLLRAYDNDRHAEYPNERILGLMIDIRD